MPAQPRPPIGGFGQLPQIAGKFIQKPEEITVRDLPRDGSVAFFPMSDYSKIIARAWDQNGNVQEEVYEMVNPRGKAGIETEMLQKINAMEKMITQICQEWTGTEKGGQDNE